MLFSSQKGLAKMLSLSADSGVEGLNKHKSALQNQAKNTAFKNAQADVLQYGRSMIEMLGVLAIIGVLSVGGIAGYSKAMMKVKINKTISQVSQIAGNIRTLYASQDSYVGLNDEIAKKAKIIPDDNVYGKSYTISANASNAHDNLDWTSKYENPFGGGIYLHPQDGLYDDEKYYNGFAIAFDAIPEDACMELATLDWGAGAATNIKAISINWFSYASPRNTGVATSNASGDGGSSIPMSVSEAATVCSEGTNYIIWTFE
jgi:Tfp pilus assembly protein PilE